MALSQGVNGENGDLDDKLIVNGSINVRLTHPNLYYTIMVFAMVSLTLSLNFLILSPTFLIYNQPNWVWGLIFMGIAILKIVFLNFYRRLKVMRAAMAFSVGYSIFLAGGTAQPFIEGNGSLQLPILYAAIAALQYPLLLEPFINPWTAKR